MMHTPKEIRQRELMKEYLFRQSLKVEALFGDTCFCCGVQTQGKRRLHLHHLSYPNGHHTNTSATRNEALRNPERFRQVCYPCHSAITRLSTMTPETLERIELVVKETKEGKWLWRV